MSERIVGGCAPEKQKAQLPQHYTTPLFAEFGELRALMRGNGSPNKVDIIDVGICEAGDETPIDDAAPFC